MKLSARNQLTGTVTEITEGAAIANVALDVNGQRLVASITVEAARELGLREGTRVAESAEREAQEQQRESQGGSATAPATGSSSQQ